MSEAVLIALIGAVGALLTGVLVELIRTRRAQNRTNEQLGGVLGQVSPNSGRSLHDAVTRIEGDVGEMRRQLGKHGERLAKVETRLSDHLQRS
ncbi:hypothetical protein [Prauserella flavalba]|uniref:hypothetical protein n=1 Tax=Prauserella flavalba TaxID=1477506 RepID=UPI0036E52AA9